MGDPCDAVRQALEQLFDDDIAPSAVTLFVHGATVATDALLEGQGAKVEFFITSGVRAVYEARG